MEHQHRNTHLLGKQKNKKANQGITPEEYKRRMAFYTKRYEDEQKEKNKQTNTPEDTPEQNTTTVNTPVSKQNGVDTSEKINAKKTPAPTTTQPKDDSSTTPEKIKQKEKELGVEELSTTAKTEVTDKDKAPETEAKTDTPKSNTQLQLPKDEEKTLNKDKADTTQGTDNSNTPQTNTKQPSTDIKSKSEKSPSGTSAKTLPGGDKMGNKQGTEKKGDAGGGGDAKRTTLVPNKEAAGSEKAFAKQIKAEEGQPKAKMLKASEPALKKNKDRIKKTQEAETKKTPVVKKLEEAKEAEVIPQKASDTEKAADGVKGLSKQEDKKADKSAIKQATSKLRQQLIMPTKLDQLQDKEFMANVDSTMNNVTDDLGVSVSAKTEEVGADYKEIDNPGLGEKPRSAKALPALEKAKETPLMDLGEMTALQKVPDEQLQTIRQAGDDADKVLKKEKIGEGEAISFEQLSEASDEDLRRGVVGYNKVQEESGSGADEVKKTEKAKHDAMTKAIKEKEQAKRSHMRTNRDEQLKASRGQQGRAKSEFEVKRAEITAQMDEVYKRARKAVTERLAKVDGEVKKRFARVKSKAMAAFTKNVETKLDKFHDDRYHYEGQGLGERIGNIWDSWFEDTSELPEVIAIFDNEKERFIAAIDAGITEIVAYVESEVAACKQIIANANTELENIVAKQSPAFKKIAKEAYTKMRKQLDKLDSEIDKKAAELKKYLAEQRKKAIEEVDKKIAEIKERLKGALHQLAKFLTDAAYKFFKGVLAASGFSTEQIDKIINQGIEVLTKIVTDPLGFFQNVVEAVGQGFNNFVGNIGKHLKNGFFAWLTGAMAGVGLNLPQKWDMKGIFSVVLQVMGLDWTGIRARIAKEVGEENLARAEEAGGAGLELLQQIKEKGFVEAVWDMLVEKAGEIQAMVITEIQNWLITSVVKQAIIKILSMLNPAGAIVQAILAIYDFAMWLINNWERIVQIIQNIVSSIGKIAMGQLGDAAKFIENTLATFVPMLLDFLARLLRLGNVSEKIKKILQRVRKPIDDLLAKIMTFIKNKIKGFGKKGKKKKETKDQTKKDMKKDKGKDGVTDVDRKKHREIGEEIERELKKPIKKAKNFDEFYQKKTKLARKLEKRYQRRLKKGIKVKISFKNLENEKKDNDIDFKIRIAPNTFEKEVVVLNDNQLDNEDKSREGNIKRYERLKASFPTQIEKVKKSKRGQEFTLITGIEKDINNNNDHIVQQVHKKLNELYPLISKAAGLSEKELKELEVVAKKFAEVIKENGKVTEFRRDPINFLKDPNNLKVGDMTEAMATPDLERRVQRAGGILLNTIKFYFEDTQGNSMGAVEQEMDFIALYSAKSKQVKKGEIISAKSSIGSFDKKAKNKDIKKVEYMIKLGRITDIGTLCEFVSNSGAFFFQSSSPYYGTGRRAKKNLRENLRNIYMLYVQGGSGKKVTIQDFIRMYGSMLQDSLSNVNPVVPKTKEKDFKNAFKFTETLKGYTHKLTLDEIVKITAPIVDKNL